MSRRAETTTTSGPLSWAWLALAVPLLFFSNGRWMTSIAPWWSLTFMLRFTRSQRPVVGLVVGGVVWCAVAVFQWKGLIPLSGPLYILVASVIGAIFFLPFIADRLVTPRIGGFAGTLVLPLAMVSIEWLNTALGPYGTWGSLAYTQADNLPLIQIVSVTGTGGVVFLIAWFASTANWAWEYRFTWKRIWPGALGYVAAATLVVLMGGMRLAFFPPAAPTVRVAGLTVRPGEANRVLKLLEPKPTDAEVKAARASTVALHDTLLQRSEREAKAGARMVLWSEANGLTVKQDEPKLIARARELAARSKIWLFLALATTQPGKPRYENQLVAIGPDGSVEFRYHKARPVPGDPETGADRAIPKPIDTHLGRVTGAICFDMDFPSLIHKAGRERADILLVPSSDWREIDPIHTRMAIFRGIENGCSVVRQTNKGLSVAADYQGRVLAAADYFAASDHRMVAQVPTRGVRTFYAAVGDLFSVLCLLALLAVAALAWLVRWPE